MAGRLRVAAYRSLGAVLEWLPERLDVALARRAARWAGRPGSATRRALRENLSTVIGADATVRDERLVERLSSRAMASYGQYWAESAKLPALPGAVITSRFVISEGLHYLDEAKAAGRGLIVALPHVGSWEWGGALLAQMGMPMTAVAEALDPPELFEWFVDKREAIGISVVALGDGAGPALLGTLRAGGVVGLLCDRDIQGNGIEATFFGARVTLPAGPATLALRTGATLVAAACYAGPGRDHHAVVLRPIPALRQGRLRDDVARVTQAVAADLEALIRRAPEQWHVLEPRFRA
ncbi:MAG: phosphatidylinositol mannoside acyltransferase [Acidimicrobiales bacterium]